MNGDEKIKKILERNKRVEADKAWETSWFRKITIVISTYIIASMVFYVIASKRPLLDALIPTIGYFLSTLSLPVIKRWWIKKHLAKLQKNE